jgi:hypothetical protein
VENAGDVGPSGLTIQRMEKSPILLYRQSALLFVTEHILTGENAELICPANIGSVGVGGTDTEEGRYLKERI